MAPLPNLHPLTHTLHPTRTFHPRQSQIIPTGSTGTIITGTNTAQIPNTHRTYANPLSGGATAGIVLGSLAGSLLPFLILGSCCNLGALQGGGAVPGRSWYGGVRGVYPPRHTTVGEGRSRGRSSSRSSSGSRSRSHRRHSGYGEYERVVPVPVQEVKPVVVRDGVVMLVE
ncbi:hypothetical protein F5144DRAFT_626215 [Chaetomium tenue]|uniref:Uncharacterized protein n=1 Tax=Chaetomium tenue TaxID=1854479 RepID=A0ACB7PRZ0_9PEZI|nr:hypothetical protein F5144DRAFT_626215 [Chaetomium globosum]